MLPSTREKIAQCFARFYETLYKKLAGRRIEELSVEEDADLSTYDLHLDAITCFRALQRRVWLRPAAVVFAWWYEQQSWIDGLYPHVSFHLLEGKKPLSIPRPLSRDWLKRHNHLCTPPSFFCSSERFFHQYASVYRVQRVVPDASLEQLFREMKVVFLSVQAKIPEEKATLAEYEQYAMYDARLDILPADVFARLTQRCGWNFNT